MASPELQPGPPARNTTPDAARWTACMRAGAQRMQAGEPADAVAHFQQAADLRPDHLSTQLNLAAALLRAGQHQCALRTYERLLTSRPGHSAAHHGRGLALNALQDRAGALAAFRAAAACDPDAWRAWGSIADMTPNEAERREAIDRVADALIHICSAPDTPAIRFVECARALINAHRHADAERFVQAQFQRFPDPANAYSRLASARYRSGDFAGAFQAGQQALHALDAGALPSAQRPNPFVPVTAVEALRELIGLLEAQGVKPFLAAGTLLGFHRDGGPLPHDRDVDIGVFRTPGGAPDIVGIVREHPDLLLRHDHRPGDRYVALEHKGIGIDVFIHDAAGGHLVCGMSDHPGDIQWRLTGFRSVEANYAGRRWRIPNPPERYLAETYGPDWRRPDPGFASAISSPALHEVDPHVRAYYAVARAKQALLTGNRTKARALLRQSPVPVAPDAVNNRGACVPQAPSIV